MHDTPGGWLIPIAIMFVLSFPPLFGHEIIAILCGDVWGVWVGFGIVAAGTVLGELGNFYAFKWCCTARGKKMEEKRLTYALYAQVVREGGLVVPTIMRLTFIPGHLLTAIFSTCGMSVWMFFAAACLSLPKQLATVYIGSVQSSGGNTPTTSAIKAVVVLATVAMTYLAMRYINKKVDQVKARVVYARRKARQERMLDVNVLGRSPSTEVALSTLEIGVSSGDSSVPLDAITPPRTSERPSTSLHMPKPQHVVWRESSSLDTYRPQRSGGARSATNQEVGERREGPQGFSPVVEGSRSSGGASRDVEVIEHGGRDSALRARRYADDGQASEVQEREL
ncbi:hypothetical protein FKP32DRAFT_1586502 [Trametes sanguinea]|nr:hypothetical protein FKP32DRAFT_1586502 [Trametes sanguinea]